jgi:hypothetical protein
MSISAKAYKRHKTSVYLPSALRTLPSPIWPLDCIRDYECAKKPETDRTFTRKVHLKKHCKNFHQADVPDHVLDIAKHFREGLAMDSWDCERLDISGAMG